MTGPDDDDDNADSAHHDSGGDPRSDRGDALDTVIPAFVSAAVPRREDPRPLEAHTFEALKGEHVVVRANGFSYRGTLVGADESELYLRGEMRWVVLPLGTVTDVRPEPLRTRPLGLPPGIAAGIGADEDDGPLPDTRGDTRPDTLAHAKSALPKRELVGEDDE